VPRAGLSREAVTALAVELIDSGPDGFERLSLSAVAARAGVAVPSLYKHVGSLADLRTALAIVAVGELNRVTARATVGRSGGDAVRAFGGALRGFALEHPGQYAAAQFSSGGGEPVDAVLSERAAETIGLIAAVLRDFELPEERMVDAVRAVRSAIHGFVDLELRGGFQMPDARDASFKLLLDLIVNGLAAAVRA
jgi:AcrR family transcriptional regulator